MNLEHVEAIHQSPDPENEFPHHVMHRVRDTFITTDTLLGSGDMFEPIYRTNCFERADIVITNPPFSRFRELIDLLTEVKKKFLLIGPFNAMCYKNVFQLFLDNEVSFGVDRVRPQIPFIVAR